MSKRLEIIIIGAGVNGVTTALALQLLGCHTRIFTDKDPRDADRNAHPEFASLFPAASVIPHSVHSAQLEKLFTSSQDFFRALQKKRFTGLTVHRHFEVFEFAVQHPPYCRWMTNFCPAEDCKSDALPARPGTKKLHGWSYDCIFADWPHYFPALLQLYQMSGGKLIKKRMSRDDIPRVSAPLIINCSGTGSRFLFDDPAEHLIVRGQLLFKEGAPLLTGPDNQIISYNYTPKPAIYSDAKGEPCDLYCYPRKDGWILGGSRLEGHLTADNEWVVSLEGEDLCPGGREVRSQIAALNQEIINHSFPHITQDLDEAAQTVGYRYLRSRNDGLRLEKETIGGKKIFHNYGHGGAGVTLSWGCALALAQEVIPESALTIKRHLQKAIGERMKIL